MRVPVVVLSFLAFYLVHAQPIVAPPTVPSREIDLTAEIDPRDAGFLGFDNPKAVGFADGSACALAFRAERVVAVRIAPDGTPGLAAPLPLPEGSERSFGFVSAVSPDGRVHVLMGADDPAGGRSLAATYSADGCASWSTPVPIDFGEGPSGGAEFQQTFVRAAIAAGPDGTVAAAWIPRRDARAFASVSSDGGATWGAPVAVSAPPGTLVAFHEGIDVAVDPASGAVVVVSSDWVVGIGQDEGNTLWITRSVDGGASFGPSTLLAGTPSSDLVGPDAVNPDLEPLPDGSIGLAFAEYSWIRDETSIVFARSTDGGVSFEGRHETELPSGQDANQYYFVQPVLAVSGDAALLLWPAAEGLTAAAWHAETSSFGPPSIVGGSVGRPEHLGNFFDAVRTAQGDWVVAWSSGTAPTRFRTSADGEHWDAPRDLQTDPAILPFGSVAFASIAGGRELAVLIAAPASDDRRGRRMWTAAASLPEGSFAGWVEVPAEPMTIGSPTGNAPALATFGEEGVVAVVDATDRRARNVYARVSHDRGVTFGPPVRVSDFGTDATLRGSPLVRATEDGWIWIVYAATPLGTSDLQIRLNSSSDGGAHWRAEDLIVATAPGAGSEILRVEAAPGGRVWIAWLWRSELWLTATVDGGSTFSTLDADQTTQATSSAPQMCAGGGRVLLSWFGRLPGGFSSTTLASWSDDGVTFTPAAPAPLSSGTRTHLLCLENGEALAAWPLGNPYPFDYDAQIQVSRFDGTTWSAPVPTGIPTSNISSPLRLASVPGAPGTIIAVSDAVRSGTGGESHVFTGKSIDGGRHWSPAVRLDDATTPAGGFTSVATVGADALAHVWASWTDDPGFEGYSMLVRRSDDGGVTWAPAVRLDHDRAPWSRYYATSYASVATVPGAILVGARTLRGGNADAQAILAAEDVFDRDRDGYPTELDCDDENPDLYPGHCGSVPPVADAGDDQVLECVADRSATALLDGSASTDAVSWEWSEGGMTLASGETASVPFGLGDHTVTLTVAGDGGDTDSDDVAISVVDTTAPTGGITYPAEGACFGGPVTVAHDFADACDPDLTIDFSPAGPLVSGHGDHEVAVTATDGSGNQASDTVAFTIDTTAPHVEWLTPTSSILLPAITPLSLLFEADDDDGAAGGVVHEWITLSGCTIFDGATYGDGDGLLSDETILLGPMALCRIANTCGFTRMTTPVLRISATDCAGNEGYADLPLSGSVRPLPGACPQNDATFQPLSRKPKVTRR